MDFPKDPKPSPEEMVATYERTCAQGLGISIEEAKKRMYACSTTTYQGFQAVMTEEESEKFKDVPGVVFVLPDSYIDPVNKEYGGDKYENGVITHRPPPVQYSRQRRDRRNDRPGGDDRMGRSFRPPMSNQQGGTPYDQQASFQGGGANYGPQQNFPQQQRYGPPQSHGPQQNYQSQQNHGPQQHYPPQQNYGHPQNYSPSQRSFNPPGQGQGMPMNNRGYAPGGGDTYQSNTGGPTPSYQGNYSQGQQGNYYPPSQRGVPQAPNHGQGVKPRYEQGYPSEGQQGNYAPMGQTGTDQGRH